MKGASDLGRPLLAGAPPVRPRRNGRRWACFVLLIMAVAVSAGVHRVNLGAAVGSAFAVRPPHLDGYYLQRARAAVELESKVDGSAKVGTCHKGECSVALNHIHAVKQARRVQSQKRSSKRTCL